MSVEATTTSRASADSRTTVLAGGQTEAGLPRDATVTQIVTATEAALGPTPDMADALSPFMDVPVELPTPQATDVTGLRIDARSSINAAVDLDMSVSFEAPGTPDDVLTFYDAELTAAGLSRVGGGQRTDFDRQVRYATFELAESPDGTDPATTVEIEVPDDDQSTAIDLIVTTPTTAPSTMDRLSHWPGDVPGLQDPRVTSVLLETPIVTMAGSRSGVSLSVSYEIPATTPADLETAIIAALPTDVYTLRSHEPDDRRLRLERDRFQRLDMTISEGVDENVAWATLSGAVPFPR